MKPSFSLVPKNLVRRLSLQECRHLPLLTAHGEHTLDIGSIEGFIDFLTLFNTAELFNALYTPSYDKSRISIREMLRFMEARRLCRRILTWFSTHYDLLSGDDLKTSPFELQKKYFNGQLRALLRYKHLEEMNLKEGEVAGEEEQVEEADILPRIGFSQLRKMIELSVDGGIEAVQVYYRLLKEDPDDHYFQSLSWSSSEKYRLRRTSSCLDGRSFHSAKIIAYTDDRFRIPRKWAICRDRWLHRWGPRLCQTLW